jgi:hypothetical protein
MAPCDSRKLLNGVLKAAGDRVKGDAEEVLAEKYHVKPTATKCIFVPPFNDFLGGRPVNSPRIEETHAGEGLGPILRSGAVDIEDAEVHLLDGTYLGHVKQLKAFG